MTVEDILYKNVVRGAEWMDDNKPGWHNEINIDELDMIDPRQCICGQAFVGKVREVAGITTGYEYARDLLGGGDLTRGMNEVEKLGFTLGMAYCSNGNWHDLGMMWVNQIEKRKAEEGTMV